MFDLFPIQVLHEEIEIPGSSIKLNYLSSRTAGYKSLLKIIMTQSLVPLNLIKVHLMVAVEGHLFQKSFQASPNLAYTFIWDKTDAYGQKVYGLSDAVGKSAYASSKTFQTLAIFSKKKTCKDFLWRSKCTKQFFLPHIDYATIYAACFFYIFKRSLSEGLPAVFPDQ